MSPLNSTIDDDYRYCEELTRARESNFSLGFAFLPAPRKRAIHVVYAFCRYVDDISDEVKQDGVEAILKAWLGELASVYRTRTSEHPIGRALADVLEHYAIPAEGFAELIQGCVLDQTKKHYATFQELSGYCELVATSIAKVSLPVYGFDDYTMAFPPARDLSFAFQLTNILRDVAEDLERGRCYLPAEDLARFGLTRENLLKADPEAVRRLFAYEGERCEAYFLKARRVLEYLHPESVRCVSVMTEAYHTLLRKVLKDPLLSLRAQTVLDAADKARITGKTA